MNTEELAKKIVDGLFINGSNRKAKRLVLELEDGGDGGGWGRKPAEDFVKGIINKYLYENKVAK